jgi:hypothetical protein
MSAQAAIDVLGTAPGHALMATELLARLVARDLTPAAAEAAVADLEQDGRVVIGHHPPPDVHLTTLDLRTVALVAAPGPDAIERARAAGEARWSAFLRDFLATHRCG